MARSYARNHCHAAGRRQRGAVAVMVAGTLFVILAMCGMAIDLGMMYNRRVELQNLADATALAAAVQLDGTPAGVARAMDSAASVAANFTFNYGTPFTWSEKALQFGTSPARTGDWLGAAAAAANASSAAGRLFARVDTLGLNADQGMVYTLFMNALGVERSAVMQGYATAGRTGIKVAPLAICALSDTPAQARTTNAGAELVEFGFRRGITYNLMNLNPKGSTPENFVINPFAPPGMFGTAGPTSPAIVGPYLCSGTMSITRVTGGKLTVARPFPLSSLVEHLNSRFDDFTGKVCNRVMAPPDANIKAFTYTSTNWMSTVPLGQGAAPLAAGGKLITVADATPTPAGNSAGQFGPLWTYAKAVPYSAYVPNQPEPTSGYATFSSSDWAKLYDPGQPKANAYPSPAPYLSTGGANYGAPSTSVRPQSLRRVLNVALLSCPVDAGTLVGATAVGVGRFMMTVPATSTALYAEFAGAVSDQSLSTSTGLFP